MNWSPSVVPYLFHWGTIIPVPKRLLLSTLQKDNPHRVEVHHLDWNSKNATISTHCLWFCLVYQFKKKPLVGVQRRCYQKYTVFIQSTSAWVSLTGWVPLTFKRRMHTDDWSRKECLVWVATSASAMATAKLEVLHKNWEEYIPATDRLHVKSNIIIAICIASVNVTKPVNKSLKTQNWGKSATQEKLKHGKIRDAVFKSPNTPNFKAS